MDDLPPEVRAALDAMDWFDEGKSCSKTVTFEGSCYRALDCPCQDCGTSCADFDMVMLKTDLWKRLYPEDGVACQACMEKRLGRPLTEPDLFVKHPQ